MYKKTAFVNHYGMEDNIMETRSYRLPNTNTTAAVRQSTQMERARKQAIGVSAVLMVVMLALAVTFTTLAINSGKKGGPGAPADLGPGEEVWTPVVMAIPIGGQYSIITGYDAGELQWNETAGGWTGNKSVKIAAGKGTAVLATYAGTITSIVTDVLEGTIVEITHRDGLVTRYLGLDSNILVKRGDSVQKGQQIGTVGNRPVDHKDGPHVKLEVLQQQENGKFAKVNPADYIPNLFPDTK